MAWFQVNFVSDSLKRPVQINALIPADSMGPPREAKPYKTLYLLHGYMGDYAHWLTNTKILEMSQTYNLAVIMPSGENAFYVDNERTGKLYSEFISKDLVGFTRKVFPLSKEREDTIIGGLSMGGYGALYNGLRHNDVFGHVIALSSAIILENAINSTEETNGMGFGRGYFESTFGDLDTLMQSDKNLEVAAKRVLDGGENITDLYIACGYNDGLAHSNRKFSVYLKEIGYPHVYEEGAGTHEWAFWNDFLKRGLDRLELVPKRPAGEMRGPFWVDLSADSPNPVK